VKGGGGNEKVERRVDAKTRTEYKQHPSTAVTPERKTEEKRSPGNGPAEHFGIGL
jgi:hypothetical protein